MPVRQTSIEVYRRIKEEKLLSKKRLQIYEILYEKGPLTYNEVYSYLPKEQRIATSNVNARINELKKMGAVYEVCVRKCAVSGNQITACDVTNNIPQKLSQSKRASRSHLEKCRDVLKQIYISKDCPAAIKKYIEESLINA